MQSKTSSLILKPYQVIPTALLLVVAFYYQTVADLIQVWWRDGSAYSHGLLLAPVSLFIFYRQLKEHKHSLHIRFSPVFLLLLPVLSALWLVAHLIQVQAAEHLVLLLILPVLMLALLGGRQSRLLVFPFVILIMTIPVWSSVQPALRTGSVIFSSSLLSITGFSHVREGYLLMVPAGTFEVTDGCSGLRYQLAGISIALLFIYMNGLRIRAAIAYLGLTMVLVFLANVLRIYIVVVAGELTGMKTGLIEDHQWLGWIIFAILMIPLLWASGRFFPADEKRKTAEVQQHGGTMNRGARELLYLVIALLLAGYGPVVAGVYSVEKYRNTNIMLDFPHRMGEWNRADFPGKSGWNPEFLKSNGRGHVYYRNKTGDLVEVYSYSYLYQGHGREAVSTLNQAYDASFWDLHRQETISISLPGFPDGGVSELVLQSVQGNRKTVWKWYSTDGKITGNPYQAKLDYLKSRLRGKPLITVFLASPVNTADTNSMRNSLTKFYRDTSARLNRISADSSVDAVND